MNVNGREVFIFNLLGEKECGNNQSMWLSILRPGEMCPIEPKKDFGGVNKVKCTSLLLPKDNYNNTVYVP